MKQIATKKAEIVWRGPTFTCGHCKRRFGMVHLGSGPALCCECVRVHRHWERLGGNQYCVEDSHKQQPWCKDALEPAREFAEQYARRSGVTVAWLREQGREVQVCDCGEMECTGFQMAYMKDWNEFVGMGEPYKPPYPQQE